MSGKIWFDQTSDKLVLSDGEHYIEVPHWAREIIGNEFERVERETRQLKTENAKLRELVEESDEELYLDIAQGLFDDLMATEEYKAKLWARAWPELFGKDEDDGSDLV